MQRRNIRILVGLVVLLLALRFWHIQADFPNYHFYSQERARFTDEGFYTSAALNYFTLGHTYIPGGWNPGVFMPVWPLMVGVLFHFIGISVVAARSLAVICTVIGVLLAYAVTRQYRSQTFALFTVLLVSVNALGFFYARLAILEPAFVMFLLLAIYLAGKIQPGNYGLAIAVGVVFVAMALTKATGLFVLPAVLYPIWGRNRGNRSAAWKLVLIPLAIVVLSVGCAKFVWHAFYAPDYPMILGVRPWWQLEHSPPRLLRFFMRGTWVDPVLFPLALAAFLVAAFRLRFLWQDTFFTMAFLWETGYAAFIVFHYDGPPRYFVALIVPTIWLALIFMEWLWREHRSLGQLAVTCILASVVWNLAFIGTYLLRPRYKLINAAMGIRRIIRSGHSGGSFALNGNGKDLLIGRGADEISLLSGGVPAMDSDGAMPLADKLDIYHPGWFMKWSNDSPLRIASVETKCRVVQMAFFPALDEHRHAGILLYRLYKRSPNEDHFDSSF